MFDVADRRRERALVVIDDPSRHVVGGQTVVGPDGCDHGDPYIRENVRRRTQRGATAKNEDQDRQDDERVGPLQGYEDNGVQLHLPGQLIGSRHPGALRHSCVVASFLALRQFRTMSPGAARVADVTLDLGPIVDPADRWTKIALTWVQALASA